MTIKKLLLIFTLSIFSNQLVAQTTNGIFFQAVARDNFSNPAKDRKIYVQSSIIQSTPTGTTVLTEEHQANTDATGVFSISLGNGVRVGGTASSLTTIDWSKGPFYLNLKVSITPIGGNSNWDYNKEWVDMGTTSFGAVPFALYSASSAKVDDKLNVSDTTTMLKVYAKAIKVQSLETSLASKLTAADTLTMLAPYAKAAYTIDSSFFKSQLATKLSLSDTINYTKQKYTDSTISKKLNIADSTIYVTKSQLASYNFSTGGGGVTVDTSSLSNRINLKANTSEITSLTSSLENKLSIEDSTKYITPTQLAAKTFDTTSLSNRINLKANSIDVTTAISTEATTARAAELVLTNNITSNTASITTNAVAIVSEAATARAAELVLTNNITSNTASITANSEAIALERTTARSAELTLTNIIASNTISISANTLSINSLTNNIATNTASISANSVAIELELTTARAAELVLTNNISSNTASITANAAAIVLEAATARAAELTLTNNVVSNTTSINSINSTVASHASSINLLTNNSSSNTNSITANAAAIVSEATTARAAELTLTNNIASNSSSITSNTSSITSINTIISAATSSNTANTIVKRDASGNFSAGSITASNYVSTPISLSYTGSTINWNPTLGANAAITLTQNSTLSFSAIPLVGSYGTVVLTQDGTGGRTITLPSIVGVTNKVLGSASNTTVNLSTAASAKDILNFYYDGTNCYWNIGQGYGIAAAAPFTLTTTGTGAATLSGTTLNIPSVSSTVNAGSVSGTIAIANGGTGASTQQESINALTGTQSSGKYLRSDGTNSTLTTIQVADVPILNQSTTGNATTATTAGNISATSNLTLTSLSNLNTVGTITSGTISLTNNINTSGTLTAGAVTYPKIHGTSGQVLTTTGSGTLTWTTPSSGGEGSGGHYVGEVYGGGIVFYVTTGGYHGLIASSTDIVGMPFSFFDKATNPSFHTYTTNQENLYVDWVAPTYAQLTLLYNARNTPGLNLLTNIVYTSSSFQESSSFSVKCLNFSTGNIAYANGNWTASGPELRGRTIRTF